MRTFFTVLVSLIENFVGVITVAYICTYVASAEEEVDYTTLIVLLVVLLLIGLVVSLIRGAGTFSIAAAFPEALTSPIAIPRIILGAVLARVTGRGFGVELDCAEDVTLLEKFLLIVVYLDLEYSLNGQDTSQITTRSNFHVNLWLLLPASFLVTGSFYYLVLKDDAGILAQIICFVLMFLFNWGYRTVRGRASTEEFYDDTYLVKVKGLKTEYGTQAYVRVKSDDEAAVHRICDEGSAKVVKGGTTTLLTFSFWLSFLLAPVLFVLQVVATIFAGIGLSPTSRVFSFYGRLNYRDTGLGCTQHILHYLFGFILV